jgi:hypothetical protein
MRLGFYPQPVWTGQTEAAPGSTGSAAATDTRFSDPRRDKEAGRAPQAGLTCRYDDSQELPSGSQSDTDETAATRLNKRSFWTCL